MPLDFTTKYSLPVGFYSLQQFLLDSNLSSRLHSYGKHIQGKAGKIEFQSVHFAKQIQIGHDYTYAGVLEFRNCYFSENQTFNRCSIRKLIFIDCYFYNGVSFSENVKIINCEFADCKCKQIQINGGQFESLNCQKGIIEKFNVAGGNIGRLIIGESEKSSVDLFKLLLIEELNIFFTNFKGSIKASGCAIRAVRFNDYINKETSVFLSGINVSRISLRGLVNDGRLVFSSLLVNEQNQKIFRLTFPHFEEKDALQAEYVAFSITKCNLGKAEFYGINFNHFQEFIIYESFIIDCAFVNIVWPKLLSQYSYPFREKVNAAPNREIFRQIKTALSKQGDIIGEHRFHAIEMNTYYYALKWKNNLWTKLILRLSFLTSNYGQSFLQPIAFIVLLNFPLFYLLVYLRQIPIINELQQQPFSLHSFIFWTGEFIKYCNPLHKLGDEIFGLAFIADTTIRIISSYGIYNLIRATRRFVK